MMPEAERIARAIAENPLSAEARAGLSELLRMKAAAERKKKIKSIYVR